MKHVYIQMSQEQRSVFREVIVSLILSKEADKYMCPIPKGFRDRAISLYSVQTSNTPLHCRLYRWATRHVLTRVAKCIDVDGGIF
ncbi:hypothetical protein B7P43_G00476 [Cryptotermes secundus]|uniref:Uncharacterized protein n=1 Tax=Cryptotermes secundus TaxID=105785 RepID=A0A2J7R8M5_9NEOP|nr:hypothetical protein B7P43_G00476 [Cryptotermes secundus]